MILALSSLGAGRVEFEHLPDPRNYKASLKSPDNALWADARQEELSSLQANQTWVAVKRLPGMQLLRTQWVYKKKRDGAGAIAQYKARVVASGDKQVLGVNHGLTFAPVMDMTTGKIIFWIAFKYKVPARHFDVPSAYLKAGQDDGYTIYLFPPEGSTFTTAELEALSVSVPTRSRSAC
ncbi:TPA: hypothetical protein N0F65_000589 [Lagenidium giganteum]|uniref:Reverse transcriptase Ty1/copia-type domain-containing protein n=1 Tax=Lagenidium giganteum TaxID=4803 RepID=A0AAV2YG43_9STRA|nr:TPA: hypothetical protein N0F65_000589 [Lagenidium giganteum]